MVLATMLKPISPHYPFSFFLDRRAPALLAQACMYQKFVKIINKNTKLKMQITNYTKRLKKPQNAWRCMTNTDVPFFTFFVHT